MSELEMGNALFNEYNANQEYSCPEWVEALLEHIEAEISRVYWNDNQEEWNSAFRNTGNRYDGSCFHVQAYTWGEEYIAAWNFCYVDPKTEQAVMFSWYKHLGRDTTVNINPTGKGFNERIISMFDDVIADIRKSEEDQ